MSPAQGSGRLKWDDVSESPGTMPGSRGGQTLWFFPSEHTGSLHDAGSPHRGVSTGYCGRTERGSLPLHTGQGGSFSALPERKVNSSFREGQWPE